MGKNFMMRKVLVDGSPEKIPKKPYYRNILKIIYTSSYFRDG